MIAVKSESDRLQMTIPTDGLIPDDVNDLVSWLRVETIAHRSKLNLEAVWKLFEEIKADWWQLRCTTVCTVCTGQGRTSKARA